MKSYVDERFKDLDRVTTKEITFDGGTADAIGDYDGSSNPFSIFSVTGIVAAKIFAVCETALEGTSATLEVGDSISSGGLIASTTATDIDAGLIWLDNSPDSSIEALSNATESIVKSDIQGNVGAANITAGKLRFYVVWKPITEDGKIESA